MLKGFEKGFFQLLVLLLVLVAIPIGIYLTTHPTNFLPFAQVKNNFQTYSVGTNYSHYQINNCSRVGTGIIASYHLTNVKPTVQMQLSAMRGNGVDGLRSIVWFLHDASNATQGSISSALVDNEIAEPYKSNLINFFSDIKNNNYQYLEISFSPQGGNHPSSTDYSDSNKSATMNENWMFMKRVIDIAKAYGPVNLYIDLLNEGGIASVNQYFTQAQFDHKKEYDQFIYKNYIDNYGIDQKITFSVEAEDELTNHRLANLIIALTELGSNYPLPAWYEAHFYPNNLSSSADLQTFDNVLKQYNLPSNVLHIGETYYNNSTVAASIKSFMSSSSRKVDQIIQWPLIPNATSVYNNPACTVISESPPYIADAYKPTPTPTPADTTKPTVKLVSPASISTTAVYRGKSYNFTFKATATDNVNVSKVIYSVGTQTLCTATSKDANGYYSCTVTYTVPSTQATGTYTLYVKGYDPSNNIGQDVGYIVIK